MRTSPDLLSWATTGTSPSGPNRTADNQLFWDTGRSYRRLRRLSKALVVPYLAQLTPFRFAGLELAK
jgi:hypothetical protein